MVDTKLQNGQLSDLSTDFNTCTDLLSKDDVNLFVGNVAAPFMSTVQYNNEMSGFTISSLCSNMMTSGNKSAYNKLRDLTKVLTFPLSSCSL